MRRPDPVAWAMLRFAPVAFPAKHSAVPAARCAGALVFCPCVKIQQPMGKMPMPRVVFYGARKLLLALALAAVSVAAVHASDDIWSALVLATNETPPAEIPKPLKSFSPTITKVFGFNSLYLLGQKKRALENGSDQWLVPSRDFFFQATCLAQEPTHYHLRIALFRGKELLLTTEAKLARDAPLFIRGPQWGSGQLILILEVR